MLYALDLRIHEARRVLRWLQADADAHEPWDDKAYEDNNFDSLYMAPVREQSRLLAQLRFESFDMEARRTSCERFVTVLTAHQSARLSVLEPFIEQYASLEPRSCSLLHHCVDLGWMAALRSCWRTGSWDTDLDSARYYDEVWYVDNERFIDWPRAVPREWWWIVVTDPSGNPTSYVGQTYYCFERSACSCRRACMCSYADVADVCAIADMHALLHLRRFLLARGTDMLSLRLYVWIVPSEDNQVGDEFVDVAWSSFVRSSQFVDPSSWDPEHYSYAAHVTTQPKFLSLCSRSVHPSPPSSPPDDVPSTIRSSPVVIADTQPGIPYTSASFAPRPLCMPRF